MPEIKSFPNNQNEYVGAEDVMRWLHGRTSGVFGAENNAAVAPVLDSMYVTVTDGKGWLSNDKGDGIVWWNSAEEETGNKLKLQVDLADSSRTRIDRVVVSWPTTNYVDLPTISILKGTPATYAAPPALTNNNVLRQISLARITIPAGTTAITSEMITDERLDPSVCGIVNSEVSIDTSVMQDQFYALLKKVSDQLDRLNLGTESMLKTTYDSNSDGKIDWEAVDGLSEVDALAKKAKSLGLGLYKATVLCDAYSQSSGKFVQSVTPTVIVGDNVTDSTQLAPPMFLPTGVRETDEALAETLSVINAGFVNTAENSIVLTVWEVPATDIELYWYGR